MFSALTGFSDDLITLVFERRDTSVSYELQADSQSSADSASSAVTSASNLGTLNAKLVTQLSTTNYAGSIPTGATATSTVTFNANSSDSSDTMLWWIMIGAGGLVLFLVVGTLLYWLCCRVDKYATESITGQPTATETYIQRGLDASEMPMPPPLYPTRTSFAEEEAPRPQKIDTGSDETRLDAAAAFFSCDRLC